MPLDRDNKYLDLVGKSNCWLLNIDKGCMGIWRLTRWLSGKESSCWFRRSRRHRFDPWVWKIPLRKKWQLTPVLLPGKSHGQRSLTGYVHRVIKSQTRLSELNINTHKCGCSVYYFLKFPVGFKHFKIKTCKKMNNIEQTLVLTLVEM